MKVRQNLYIERELSEALEGLAALRRGGNKSRIVNEALKDWLEQIGQQALLKCIDGCRC